MQTRVRATIFLPEIDIFHGFVRDHSIPRGLRVYEEAAQDTGIERNDAYQLGYQGCGRNWNQAPARGEKPKRVPVHR
jgi:hypothetical protein